MKKKNPFEEFGSENKPKEIQKSDIFEAMRETQFPMVSVNKTGAEIKSQINNVVLPKLQKVFEEKFEKLNDLLGKTGNAPTKPIYFYKVKLDLPYKEYEWCETQFRTKEAIIYDNFANPLQEASSSDVEAESEVEVEGCNAPKSVEEAKARIEYNECLRGLVEVGVDIKTCNALNQLKDDSIYSLSTTQLIALGWGE